MLCFPEFGFKVVHRARKIPQETDALSRLPIGHAEDNPLDDDVPTMLISDDAEPNAASMCLCFTFEEEGRPMLPFLLVAVLVNTTTYAPPPTLEEFLTTQWMDAYCKQATGTVRLPGSVFPYDKS